ncbi:MAG: RNA polymerase-binding transcription factor DksA [Polaribacter sp.]|jgi:RNA polymerase-binding transcription factor DksA
MATPEKNKSLRYSDEELAEFKKIIDKKITDGQEQVRQFEEQVRELNESLQTSGADLGDNSAYTDVEFINNLIFRQKKQIQDFENALLRIKNKVYGICILTGDLIDKKRLLIVPTTMKGLVEKTEAQKRGATKSNRRTLLSDRKPKAQFTKTGKKAKPEKIDPLDEEEIDLGDMEELND